MIGIIKTDKRVTLSDNQLTLRYHNGDVVTRIIISPEELLDVLRKEFLLEFLDGTIFGPSDCPWPYNLV